MFFVPYPFLPFFFILLTPQSKTDHKALFQQAGKTNNYQQERNEMAPMGFSVIYSS